MDENERPMRIDVCTINILFAERSNATEILGPVTRFDRLRVFRAVMKG